MNVRGCVGTVREKVRRPFAISRGQAISSGGMSDGKISVAPVDGLTKQMLERLGDNRVGVTGKSSAYLDVAANGRDCLQEKMA